MACRRITPTCSGSRSRSSAIGDAVLFSFLGLHQKWWRYFNLGDSWKIVRACIVASALMLAIYTLAQPFPINIPRSVLILDFLLTVGLLIAGRSLVRFAYEYHWGDWIRRRRRGSGGSAAADVVIVGAGSGGQMVVRELMLNPDLGRPVGFIDDDPHKQGTRPAAGLKVLGTTERIGEILDEIEPDEVIIAIPSAPGHLRGKVVSACRDREIRVRTLPTVFELLRGGVQLTRQVREVQVEDVLGRDPVIEELDLVGGYLRDRIVLVTGAGGSIGAELSRQIAARAAAPARPRRPRRGQPLRDRSRARLRVALQPDRVGPGRLQGRRTGCSRSCSASSPRSSSTPPPTSTCR